MKTCAGPRQRLQALGCETGAETGADPAVLRVGAAQVADVEGQTGWRTARRPLRPR